MAVNHFDQASRFAAKLDAVGFLAWLLNLSADAFAFRGWIDARSLPFPGDSERFSDTVAYLEDRTEHGVPWAVAIEFQSQPDPLMFGRMLGYLSGIWMRHKPDDGSGSRFQLGAAIVNLIGTGTTSRDMSWPGSGLRTLLQPVERNLQTESAADLLAGIESGKCSRCLLPWIPLMLGGGDADTIDQWKVLAESEPNRRRKAEYAGLALVFSDKGGCKELWQQKLEGWNMEESTVVNEWIAKGEQRGEARGISIGEARGEIRQAQEMILRLGRKPFGTPSDEIAAAVHAIHDLPRLERIAERVFDASNWTELLATP